MSDQLVHPAQKFPHARRAEHINARPGQREPLGNDPQSMPVADHRVELHDAR